DRERLLRDTAHGPTTRKRRHLDKDGRARSVLPGSLLNARLEALEQLVPAFHHTLQTGLRVDLAREDTLRLAVLDFTDLRQEAQAQTARVLGGIGIKLRDGHFGTRILLVETGSFGDFVASLGHRNITGRLVPFGCLFRAGDVLEELG